MVILFLPVKPACERPVQFYLSIIEEVVEKNLPRINPPVPAVLAQADEKDGN